MLEKPGLHLDSVTKTFKENHCGMDLVVQKRSDIRKKGNKVVHPEDVPKKKYLEVIGRHRNCSLCLDHFLWLDTRRSTFLNAKYHRFYIS